MGGIEMKCQIKVIKEILDLFPKYRPKLGKIYDAELSPSNSQAGRHHLGGKCEFCIVDILNKKIILRKGEYEILSFCN
jgi:hypothetical protein